MYPALYIDNTTSRASQAEHTAIQSRAFGVRQITTFALNFLPLTNVWAGAPSCYLELLDKLQKQICRTVGPSLAASLEPLAHRQNVPSLSLFYMYYFDRCSSEPAELVPLPYF